MPATTGSNQIHTDIVIPSPKSLTVASLMGAIALAAPVHAASDSSQSGTWQASSGIDYSSGSYGDDADTNILFIPASISYQRGASTTKLTVPWLRIEGPGSVVGGGDSGVVTGGMEAVDASGLGDIWLQQSFAVDAIPSDWFYLDLVGKVKFPTADEAKGLGTGAFDYTVQLDFFKPLGKLSPMATLAYKIKGDPDGSDLNNVFYTSIGADYRLTDSVNFGTTLDYQEASSASSDDAIEVFSYLGYKASESTLLTFYTYFGLTDGSPDLGGGIQCRYEF
ncbi:hypothetical protein [Sulfuriroseicoccus oceanibius]|uniref:Uncharacterized protein n=1 Tax=Sulfuriroseicoccus oceanibius TaxID=2707525 RepID=A0A7T7F3A8_9BACT|nr:hypothetical protein [Sulfuriroseicoccus oceanibius]QQL45770.1 hypothetical protein G3M56_004075 [Sulfuriroseicoccus oceanibius]